MAISKPKTTEMSKPAEILYRVYHDELRFAKQQQWMVTNYALLLVGAIYGLARVTLSPQTPWLKVLWIGVVALSWSVHVFILCDLQGYIRRTRENQKRIEATFSPDDRKLAGYESSQGIQWV